MAGGKLRGRFDSAELGAVVDHNVHIRPLGLLHPGEEHVQRWDEGEDSMSNIKIKTASNDGQHGYILSGVHLWKAAKKDRTES